ncbi:MAG: hypothetical protein M5U28_39610 [Sandaracinaceae bacterium]|nr:hypothetical protein [Sandaracinaceae bacterium]
MKTGFDFFVALDGNGLNGFEGFGGVARLRCDPDRDRYDVEVRFFDGVAGAHATQIDPSGELGFLGNLSQTLLFYDPRTLEEKARLSTLRFGAPKVVYESQTHVVWLPDRRFITAIGPDFWLFSMDDLEHPERLGAHGVTLPHAVKRSASGRYLFYGAMDHDASGFAHQAGVFDLEAREARVVRLPATVWHLGVHPHEGSLLRPHAAVPAAGRELRRVRDRRSQELPLRDRRPERHGAPPPGHPEGPPGRAHLGRRGHRGRGPLERVRRRRHRARRARGPAHRALRGRAAAALARAPRARAARGNLVEALARANVIGEPHLLVKALRASRGQLLDGSYGLGLSPDRRWLLSAHRGLNEVIVYRYPELTVHRRVPFPPLRRFFREHLGVLDDPRLGFHHATLTSATIA